MQISRHWRMNSQRYRLEGYRYENGEVSLQNRPVPVQHDEAVEMPVNQNQRSERDSQSIVVNAA